MELQPGTAVTPNLRLVRLLGRGAMGSVWVAEHLTLNSHVAIKFMAANVADDPMSVTRFSREAKAAAQIRNPHVVQIFDHGVTHDGVPFIVMELLEGEGLDKRLRRLGPISVMELLQIVTQVCKALAKAHEVGIIHRDIKPANIFLSDSGGGDLFVKVLDFGVAKFSSEQQVEMTSPGHMVGTPSYMSPEQYFDGQRVSYRSDLWSLGIVAYAALTGNRPFRGETLGELCVAIKAARHAPPSGIRGDLPPAFDQWMAKALARDPADRFSSSKTMAEELEQALGSASVMGSSPSLVATGANTPATFAGTSLAHSGATTRPGGRRGALIVLFAVVGALAIGGVGAGALLAVRGSEDEAPSAASEPSGAADEAQPSVRAEAEATAEHSAVPAAEQGAGGESSELRAGDEPQTSTSSASSAPTAAPRPGGLNQLPGAQDERTQRAKDTLGI